ncbi:extracellular solute-binding protein [Alicyclobacillus fastidiosus]|uniref:Extracellular solute-binding protein n=1 Tax=Alicyclobacillus fastidiosus TaxID=392011 RepID=A0ABY6ZNF1_9BACL|nr:extracellular solute-binding protein [Alicyclobacillus fastidiosus]WAH44404.1 extracellular solute-binding protein [Alicyclobacillus fastidiosus]GMA60744.1 hypothetical protein GCM10025859_11840 [Alicyclobacillus fastidiosus]
MSVKLNGITWNHSRGYASVVAAAQRFSEINPDIEIMWEKRSLQEFADYPIDQLIDKYDLLVIDHPWAGFAYANSALLPLEKYLSKEYLDDQKEGSVGKSFESYNFNGSQFALAIDAATPVAAYREDLLKLQGTQPPQTWADVLKLARLKKVIFPAIPIDTLMNFYMLCVTMNGELFTDEGTVVDEYIGTQALEQLKELASLCPNDIFNWNPIQIYEMLTRNDDFVYCPFAYGYSNYSRQGYSRHNLVFDDLVSLNEYGRLVSTLGGTGIAISASCQNINEAVLFAEYVASPNCQKSIYFTSGGQPGHRSAWLDEEVNSLSNQFFKNTLPTLDRAYVRPRYCGYLYFQDHAGVIVQEYLRGNTSSKAVLDKLKNLYHQSTKEGVSS